MQHNNYEVILKKTSKIDVNENSHYLPPDLGNISEFKVADYNCPKEWSKDGVFVPVTENQPLWFDFRGNEECAVLCSVQRINPVTGEASDLEKGLTKNPKQNYLVLPEQRWLDGYSKDGIVYQFVVTKAGEGLAVNECLLPTYMQDSHALGFAFYRPKNPKPKPILMPNFNHNLLYSKVKYLKYNNNKWNWENLNSDSYLSDNDMTNPKQLKSTMRSCGGGTVSCASLNPVNNGNQFYGSQHADCDIENNYRVEENDSIGFLNEIDFDKASMGAGGRIGQTIATDNNSIDYYVEKPSAILTIYLALPEMFNNIMSKGKIQSSANKDKYIFSGEIGNRQIPLIK